MTMTKLGKSSKFQASNKQSRRTLSCLALENICLIPRKVLPVRRICLSRRLFYVAATTSITPAHIVIVVVDETTSSPGFCMTLEIWLLVGLVTSISLTHNITAPSAVNVLLLTHPTMLYPRPTTLIASFPWPCAWWWKMGCHTNKPVGICGVIIAFLFPSPRSKTGSRVGEKKAADKMQSAYLDWALEDFSGYIAADELYDGPFCILSIVDNHTFKRLCYEVLDHDPTHDDIRAFFRKFQGFLQQRGLTLRGITTDASPLYPVPIAEIFDASLHQVC